MVAKGLNLVIELLKKDLALLRTLCLLISLAFVFPGSAIAAGQLNSASADPAAFALPDGSIPIICFGNGAPDTKPGKHCDECLQSLNQPMNVGELLFAQSLNQKSDPHNRYSQAGIHDLPGKDANPVRGPPLI